MSINGISGNNVSPRPIDSVGQGSSTIGQDDSQGKLSKLLEALDLASGAGSKIAQPQSGGGCGKQSCKCGCCG